MSFTQIMFGFGGRIARLPYFGYNVLATVVGLLCIGVGAAGFAMGGGGAVLGGILFLAGLVGLVWASLALAIKRLHDMGMGGIHLVWIAGLGAIGGAVEETSSALSVICTLASLGVQLWLLFTPGEPHSNDYGPPSGAVVAASAGPAIAARS